MVEVHLRERRGLETRVRAVVSINEENRRYDGGRYMEMDIVFSKKIACFCLNRHIH